MNDQKQKQESKVRRSYRLLSILMGAVFLCCIIWIAAYFLGQRKAEENLEQLRGGYSKEAVTDESNRTSVPGATDSEKMSVSSAQGEEPGDGTGETDGAGISEQLAGYGVTDRVIDIKGQMQEVNPDIYAWIIVPGTVIDYPILQHPEEMDYYLDHNLDGTRGYPGCIYTQRMNQKDFSDPNTVLYGHNMKAGTMFAGLHQFKDEDFFKDNRYIIIYTEDERLLVYEIVAAYVNGNEHLLMNYMLHTEDGFQQYLDGIYEHTGTGCNFLTERELLASDRLITLSTCISGQDDKRYLVQGVLIYEGECPSLETVH